MRHIIISAALLALIACGSPGGDGGDDDQANQADRMANATTENLADSMASDDDGERSDQTIAIADSEERPIMQLQVVLDRRGFGPGVIDGQMGMSTENALLGFQEANGLEVTGQHDDATKQALARWDRIPATRVVRIPQSWAEMIFEEIPEEPAEKAKMKQLGYTSLDEKLAERFHTTIDTLRELNPDGKPAGLKDPEGGSIEPVASQTPQPVETPEDAKNGVQRKASYFSAGQLIRVPNIGADRIAKDAIENEDWRSTLVSLGVGSDQPDVDRIVVSKAGKTLRAYQGEELVALFTVSSGSSEFPLPLGEWKILGEAYNPPYSYDPEVLGKDDPDGETHQLPPGPNSPVGIVWIDLSKEHYGIHGTPDPQMIGRAQSSGCVRLTNWDAARLAEMVSQSTQVIFEA